jgi:hypothetical protein
MRKINPLYLILILFVSSANADINSSLLNCKRINDDTKRLACFDALAAKSSPKQAKEVVTETIQKAPEPVVQPIAKEDMNAVVSAPKVKTSSPVVAQENQPKENEYSSLEAFGQSEKVGLESITSNLIGTFTGWKKGLKLKLENGQVWRVMRAKSGYIKKQDPKITITRGTLGSFDAKIEGLNARAKVRRVK